MKRTVPIFIFALLTLSCVAAEAQGLRCTFRYSHKIEADGKYKTLDDLKLDYCNQRTAFYADVSFLRDSLRVHAFDEKGRRIDNDAYAQLGRLPLGLPDYALMDFAAGWQALYHEMGPLAIIGDGGLELPEWELVPDTDTLLLGYAAHKAAADYLGRRWEIWFAPEIQAPVGPWLLWGAPGLIVSAHDSENLFVFEMTGLESLDTDSRISFLKWYYEDFFERKQSSRLQRFPLFRAESVFYKARTDIDFMKQAMGESGNRAYMVDSNGMRRELKMPPYIPIIPTQYKGRK